jgi:hypothetical protein
MDPGLEHRATSYSGDFLNEIPFSAKGGALVKFASCRRRSHRISAVRYSI